MRRTTKRILIVLVAGTLLGVLAFGVVFGTTWFA